MCWRSNADDLSDDISPAVATHRLSRASSHNLHHGGSGDCGGGGVGGAMRIRQAGGQDGRLSSRTGSDPARGADAALGRDLVRDDTISGIGLLG